MILKVILIKILDLYALTIIARVILSWIRPTTYHPAIHLINRITEPVLAPVRRVVPLIGGTIDISPLIIILLINLLRRILISI